MAGTGALDRLTALCGAASAAARNMGLTAPAQHMAPEHWQRVLSAVEAQAQMRGTDLPAGWRDDLAEQMGRTGREATDLPES
jgi:hypothetical protein